MNVLVKSGDKFYYSVDSPWSISSYNSNCLINGKEAVKTLVNEKWYVSDDKPKTITRITTAREYTNWKIKNEYTHLNLPAVVDKFETDEDDEYPSESMFYIRNFVEKQNEETQDIEWGSEVEEDVSEPALFTAVNESSYGRDKLIKISPASSLVDSLIYPDITLPSKACALTGDQLYKIIRYHVKTNIDNRYAKISSDYDFCFTVRKLLAVKPETRSYDARVGRQRAPRFKTYTITDREVDVFEMTPPSKNYQGYTPTQSIRAASHAELKKKLYKFLDELMAVINQPLESCKTCEGAGVVKPEKVAVNG